VDALMVRGFHVKVVDNLSSGNLQNVEGWIGDSRFELVHGDLKDLDVACRSVGSN
jgi:nucleoside-diphosphate-sugar epimerase